MKLSKRVLQFYLLCLFRLVASESDLSCIFGAFIVFFKIDYIDDCKTNNIQDRVDLINLMYDKVFLQVILSHKLVVE